MKTKKYLIKNYRGIKDASFFVSKKTIFTGENGIGKSSIIQLIKLLMTSNDITYNNIEDQKVLDNWGQKFECFYHDTTDKDKFEYFYFNNRGQLIKYATFRLMDIIIFDFNQNGEIKYTIVNDYLESVDFSSDKEIKKFISFLKKQETNTLPFPDLLLRDNYSFSGLFNLFAAFSMTSEDEALVIRKNYNDIKKVKNSKKSDDLDNKQIKLAPESESFILKCIRERANINRYFYTNQIFMHDPLRKFNKDSMTVLSNANTRKLKEINDFLKKSTNQNIEIKIDQYKNKFGIEKQAFLENNGLPMKIEKFGDGLEQVLPFFLYESQINIFRQPEIHLHPKMVAEFASYLYKYNKSWILETHSKELLDRIRYDKSVDNKNKSDIYINTIYYDNKKNEKNIESILVQDDGRIPNADKYLEFFNSEEMKWF